MVTYFKTRLNRHNLVALIVILFAAAAVAKGIESTSVRLPPGSDMIRIDAMKTFGDLERPEVLFPHDRHANAIEKTGGDCKTCHKVKEDKLLQTFMAYQYTNGKDAMDTFHDTCIGCHKDNTSKNQSTGPVACADCHNSNPQVLSSRQPMGMDNSLHYRHLKAYDKKCEVCHTDCETDTYKKGEETTCRHCHEQNLSKNNVISLEQAAHDACINCHLTRTAEKKETGPVKCGGCHDPLAQKEIEKISPVPRLERNQPDVLNIKTGDRKLDEPGKNRMDFVAFNHKGHENDNDTCRVCHHQTMSACNTCHTLEGSKDSKGVTLEQAMHKMDRDQSCSGCHKKMQDDITCAGCHASFSKTGKSDNASCLMCHTQPLTGEALDENTAAMIIEQRTRAMQAKRMDTKDIPENIILKDLVDKYEPVNFPHGKIVNTIARNIKENKLAQYFHSDKGTLCLGCHHNSPATDKPTRCKSCHGKPFNGMDLPGIMGAYHIQCMGCHTKMKIDQVGCTDCHKEKQ
jgi:hypothetical protein